MRSSDWISESRFLLACRTGLAGRRSDQSGQNPSRTTVHGAMLLILVFASLAAMPALARSQALLSFEDPTATTEVTTPEKSDLTYIRPTERTKVSNYAFDAFGPYSIAGLAVVAGIGQLSNAPPEWNQGLKGYGRRLGSDYGIAVVTTTTRYELSEAFREDAMYYRCECGGFFTRLNHALISTFTARRGEDGYRVFSFPALVAPYAGSMTAVYAWYPNRYGAKDAFRTGNYSLLVYAGGNVTLEYLYSGPHSLLHRVLLNNAHGSPDKGPNI